MMIDARTVQTDEVITADVCIVGSGPAGMTLAREFVNQPFRVFLLESGGLEFDEVCQSLYDGTTTGDPFPSLSETRRRQIGGTSHCWEAQMDYRKPGVRCLPFDEIDFVQRDWVPYSGWPFSRSHLEPFYHRAQQVFQVGPFDYDAATWESLEAPRLHFADNQITTQIVQFGPRSVFTQEYRELISQAKNIQLLFHANVMEIETNETAQVATQVRVASLAGNEFKVAAKVFILATGGVENARLLLLSNRTQTCGLGNQQDLVGRFFMDHPIVNCGMLVPYNPKIFAQTALYDIRIVNGIAVMGRLMVSEEVMRRQKLLNSGALLFPRPQPRQSKGLSSFKTIMRESRRSRIPKNLASHLQHAIAGSDYIAAAGFWLLVRRLPNLRRGSWSYLPYEKRRFSLIEVVYQTEQAPDPNNRVTLSAARDRLGQNRAHLHWKLNDIDLRSIKHVQDLFVEQFAQAGLGKLNLDLNFSKDRNLRDLFDDQFASAGELRFEYDGRVIELHSSGIHHHTGTTRMHNNPKQGVVDADCKVHGVSNLFIAGSSVFPTGGYANPTLTIVAMAIRLADHVKGLMATNTNVL